MVKSFKKLGLIALVVLFVNIVIPANYLPQMQASEYLEDEFLSDNEANAIGKIKKNKNMQVISIGNLDFSDEISKDLTIDKLKDLNELKKFQSTKSLYKKDIKTIMLDKDTSKEFLYNGNMDELKQSLDDGCSLVMFISSTLEDLNQFYYLTRNGNYYESVENVLPLENTDVVNGMKLKNMSFSEFELGYVCITKNANNEYIKSISYVGKEMSNKERVKKAIISAWHRQKDYKVKSVFPKKGVDNELKNKLSSLFNTTAYAADYTYGDITVGSAWRQWGWNKYDFQVAGNTYAEKYKTIPPYATPRPVGKLTVWYQWADLKSTAGQTFVANVKKNIIMPQSGFQSWGMYVGGDTDYCSNEGYTNQLFETSPIANPSSTTYTWNVGGSISVGYNKNPSISGTFTVTRSRSNTVNDIWISDNSDWTGNNHNCWIGYRDDSEVDSDYCTTTSRQDSCTISLAKVINGTVKTTAKTYAYFYELGRQSNSYSCGYYYIHTLNGVLS